MHQVQFRYGDTTMTVRVYSSASCTDGELLMMAARKLSRLVLNPSDWQVESSPERVQVVHINSR